MSNSTTPITIAATYMTLGTFGILENSLTAYLMIVDSQMKNPTYFYMIVSCILDAIILLPLTSYSSLSLLHPLLAHPWAMRAGAFSVITIWYALCFLMVFTCLSRYVQLEMSHKVPVYFTRRNLILSVGFSFLIPAVMFSGDFWYPRIPSQFSHDLYAWEFVRETSLGNVMFIGNICFDAIIACLINALNLMSLLSIRRRRRLVQTLDTSGNSKREVKLFVQCAVTGCMFTALCGFYGVLYLLVANKNFWYEYLMIQLLWILHHLQNPIIYFCMNSRLRRRFLILLGKSDSSAHGVT